MVEDARSPPAHKPKPQVQVAAADARPDLALPAGQHEALVYVWCVRVPRGMQALID